MADRTLELSAETVVGIVSPDERKRVALGRYIGRGEASEWRVHRLDGGKTLVLVQVET